MTIMNKIIKAKFDRIDYFVYNIDKPPLGG